jgi:cutinase
MHNSVKALPETLKKKVIAGVLFGDTLNKQDVGQVPNYPKDQVMIFCDKQDGVCGGQLSVTNAHMVYMENGDGPKAVAFLKGKIDAVLKSAPLPAATPAAVN